MAGLGGVVLELLAQVADINAQVMTALDISRPPYLGQQLALGQHLTGVSEQHRQQAELDRRQADRLAAPGDLAPGEVDDNLAEGNHRRHLAAAASASILCRSSVRADRISTGPSDQPR